MRHALSFRTKVDKLDPRDEDYAAHLRAAILKLTRDAAAHFADYDDGEVPAILERSRFVLSWLQSEAEDAEDRQRRYNRQQAVLNLLFLCSAVAQFHRSGKRKTASLTELRDQVADALRGLIPGE